MMAISAAIQGQNRGKKRWMLDIKIDINRIWIEYTDSYNRLLTLILGCLYFIIAIPNARKTVGGSAVRKLGLLLLADRPAG